MASTTSSSCNTARPRARIARDCRGSQRVLHCFKAAGRLAVSAARFQDAVSELTEVPGDAEAQYYLGLAYAGLGQNSQAAAMWSGIPLSSVFGVAATFQLACLDALTNDLATAATLFDGLNTVRAGAL